ncbi:hypothetical protein V6N11_020675 [Hibiscus sabdariffa]|uniref:Sodium/calcium exchanger membrane region domain-containing protein n=1 Tax=Hibiscus sabdariffa TaxID=183260 RepID=A0ABR2Q936_9ROSI
MEPGDERYVHVVDDGTDDREATEAEAEQRRIQEFSVGLEEGHKKHIGSVIYKSIYTVVLSKKSNVLIPLGPLAILVQKKTDRDGWVFILGLLGIIPLAERLSYTTEQLAFYSGPTVGGLLNATFGNATELIVSIYALRTGRIRVVQLSLLGLLLMAMMGLVFPATLRSTGTELHFGISELALSRICSCVLILAYLVSIIFQLKNLQDMDRSRTVEILDGDEDEEAAPEISKWESLIWLAITAAAISNLSEYLVDAIEGTSLAWGVPVTFISVILLPIGGNTAAVTTSVMFAIKDKLIPFCVVTGWLFGLPVDLNFQLFETATLFMTVLFAAFIIHEGTSNYLKGVMLHFCYLLVAASYFVHEDPSSWMEQMTMKKAREIDDMTGDGEKENLDDIRVAANDSQGVQKGRRRSKEQKNLLMEGLD